MSAGQETAPTDKDDTVPSAVTVTGTPTSVTASSTGRTPKSSPAAPEPTSRGARRIHCNTCNTFSSTDKKEFYNHRRSCACQDLAAEDATLETPHHRRASLRHSRASDLKTAPTVAKGSSASEKTPPAPFVKGERASKRAAALTSTQISPLATKTFKSSRRSSASCTVKETPLVDSAEGDLPETATQPAQEDQTNEKPSTGLKLVLQHVIDRQASSRRVKQEWAAHPKTPAGANKSPARGSDSTKAESSPRVERADSDSSQTESSFDKTSARLRSAENSSEITTAKNGNVSSEAKIRLTNVLAELKLTAELKSGTASAASPKPADPEQPLRADMPAEEGSPATAQAEAVSAAPAVLNYSYSDSDDDDDDDHYMEGGDDYDMDEPPLVMADYVTANGSPATRPGNIQNRTYMCKMCGFSTNSAMENLIHEKDEHGLDFDIYKCDQCDYATKYKQKLPRHRRLHYSGKRQPFLKALDVSDNGSSSSVKSPAAITAVSVPPTLMPGSTVTAVSQTVVAFAGLKRTSTEAFGSEVGMLPPEVVMDENDDEECEEDEVDDNGSPRSSTPGAGTAVAPPAKKKRKDVSPDKYFEVADELASTKFGCAICGNVYKWKKSLNKHWKEKHAAHPGNQEEVPPGMQVLIDQGNHEFTEPRRCCHKSLLAKISIPRPEVLHRQNMSSPSTPENFLNGHYRRHDRGDEMDGSMPYGFHSSGMPMGSFAMGINQPVFPGQRQLLNTLNGPIQTRTPSVLNLSTHSGHDLDETDSIVEDNARPLDFSAKGDNGSKGEQHRSARSSPSVSSIFSTSTHEATTEEDEEVSALNQLAAANKDAAGSQGKEVLKCPRCGEVCKTQTAYSNHMAIHNPTSNKRVARCAQCSLHFPNNDALNNHFQDVHIDLIASHKEAIQKIPHGLQQTYHLLMPIQNIPKLTSQGTDDPLKCNMCDFTAKWPAELQKHAVSHSDERPFICMVCGSTYKWKWDLVKHFEKAHANLPNPYKRRDQNSFSQTQTSDGASTSAGGLNGQDDDDAEDDDLPPPDLNASNSSDPPESFLFDQNSQDGISTVENMLRTSQQAAALLKSQQPNFLDGPSDGQSSSSGQAQPLRLSNADGAMMQNPSGLGYGGSGANRPGSKISSGKSSRGRPSSGLHYPKSKSGGSSAACRTWQMSYRTVEGSDSELKFMCLHCDYKARWPSEITQHMKNHSTEKPYGCPNCSYRSKWKWDVVKHLKRCGGGTIKDVIDFSNLPAPRDGPPNVMVTPEGGVVSQPQAHTPPSHAANEDQPPPPSEIPDANLLMHTFFIPPGSTKASHNQLALLYNLYSAHHAALPKDSSTITGASLPTPTTSDAATSSSSSTPEPPGVAGNAEASGGQSCMICHLVTPSAAELKRHMVMHSEEKPYKCECGYCTRWKCDVKKHKDKYQHGGPVKIVRTDGTEEFDKDTKQCSHCSFLTYSDEVLLKHVQDKHKDLKTPIKTPTGKKSPSNRKSSPSGKRSPDSEDKKSPLKFNCSPCSYSTNELAEWVNHRRQHQSSGCETRQSPNLNGFSDVDDARLKHPRKTVKRSCYKCSFTCLKSSELKAHFLEVHGAHKCAFCDLHFATKTTLLDHLITHPEFNCAEWEPFFADNDDEDFNNNTAVNEDAGSKSSTDTGCSVSKLDPSSASTSSSHPVGHSLGQDKAAKSYDCELCDKSFADIISLVCHMQANHPEEMKRKESSKGISVNSGSVINGGTFLSPSELKAAVINSLTKGASFASLQNSPNIVAQLGQPHRSLGLFKVNPLVPALPRTLSSPNSEKGLNLSIKKSPSPSSFFSSASTTTTTHPAPSSGKGQSFQCRECPYATTDMASFVEHAHMHSKLAAAAAHNPALNLGTPTSSSSLSCTQCKGGVTCPSLAAYREHLVKAHNVLSPVTGFSSKQQTAAHVGLKSGQDKMKSHLDVGNLLRVEKVMTYKQVPIQCHKLNNELMYKCTECHLMNKSCQSVYTHMMSIHGRKIRTHPLGAGAYFCGICGLQFESFQRALMHHTTAHREAKPEVVVRYYEDVSANQERIPCKACDNVVLGVDEMRAHLAYYPFFCEPCAFHADSKEDMSSHYAQEHATSKTSTRSLLDHPSLLGDVRSLYNPAARPPSITANRDLTPLDLTAENDRKDSAVASKLALATEGLPDLSKVKEERRSSQDEVKAADDKQAQPSPLTPNSANGSSNGNKRVFKCAHCPFTTDVSQCVYRNHCKGHGLKKRYPCDYCTYSQDVLAELMEHRLLHRDLPDFINEYAAPEPEPVRTPTPPPASPPRPLECQDCPFQSTERAAFQEHVQKHSQRLPHICDFCDWTDHTVDSLRQHRQVHADDEEYAEDPSDSVFANPEYAVQRKEELKAMISETSPTALPILSIKKMVYACPHCPYESRNSAAFDYHSQLHGGPGCFACDKCSYHTDRWSLSCQHSRLHADREVDVDVAPPPLDVEEDLVTREQTPSPTADRQSPDSDSSPVASEATSEEMAEASDKTPPLDQAAKDSTLQKAGEKERTLDTSSSKDSANPTAEPSPVPELPVSSSSIMEEKKNTRVYCCGECEEEFAEKRLLLQHYEERHK